MKTSLIFHTAILLLMLAFLLQAEEENKEEGVKLTKEQCDQLGLKITTAGPGQLNSGLTTRGVLALEPDRVAHIIPKISGIAKEIYKNIGSSVKAGEVIALLESQAMAELKASYLAAYSKMILANSSAEREERLYKKGVSAEQDYLNASHQFSQARIDLQLAYQKLRGYGLSDGEIRQLTDQETPDLTLYPIHSPIDGTVIMRHITKGEYIETPEKLFKIADLNQLWVEIAIYPNDLSRVKEGQMVEITHASDDSISSQAAIIYISPLVSQETITTQSIALLDNSQGLWRPGEVVKTTILIEKIPVSVVIPKEAIQTMDGKDYVFVASGELFEKREVHTGRSDAKNVEILTGLQPGTPFVAVNTFILKADLNKNSIQDED